MKRLLLLVFIVCCGSAISAQDAMPDSLVADTVPAPVLTEHIFFEGVEVKGDIYEFAKAMQKNGFTVSKRLGNENAFIFKGTVCGQSCYVQASYTKHSRTVYKLMVQPKHVDLNVFLDSLRSRYGEVFDDTERGYQWMLPNGAVMFVTPDGYDPTLVVMDAKGVAAYKEENDRPRMR